MRTYQYERRLHWSECDPAGIVFFPNYTRWMVEGLNEMFLSLGIDPNAQQEDGGRGGLPVVQLAMKFFEAPTLHSIVRHEIRVEKIGGKSLAFTHRFWCGQTLLVEASETRVWAVHAPGGKPAMQAIAVPESVRGLLGANAEES